VRREFERWLAKRAAAGDQTAIETLIENSRARLHGLVSTFVHPPLGIEREVAYQLVCVEAWRSIQRGGFNPHRGDFYAVVSTAARHRLIEDAHGLRATKRWNGQRPDSLDIMPDLDGIDGSWDIMPDLDEIDGSWITYVDSLRVVIARETLRQCWEANTAFQREAIATYLACGPPTYQSPTGHAITRARRQARPILAA
jgi:DNA-directed RNA polymerase specialized sigma24 family protein